MTGQTVKTFSRIMLCLLLTLLLVALTLPAGAEAYIALSSGGSTTGYWIARSQPVNYYSPYRPVTQPAPATPLPAPPPAPVPKPAPAPQPAPSPLPPQIPGGTVTLNAQERLLFDLVNNERISRGLAPLKLHGQLTQLARLKSQDMLNNNYFAHESPTYGRSGDMLRSAGIRFSLAAENIGMGGNVRSIFDAFMNSSGHRNKIISPRYTHTGIGIVYQQGKGYRVTQIFMLPK